MQQSNMIAITISITGKIKSRWQFKGSYIHHYSHTFLAILLLFNVVSAHEWQFRLQLTIGPCMHFPSCALPSLSLHSVSIFLRISLSLSLSLSLFLSHTHTNSQVIINHERMTMSYYNLGAYTNKEFLFYNVMH